MMAFVAVALATGAMCGGFEVQQVETFPASGITAYKFVHKATGARWAHLACDDSENLFSITFPTLPTDDTGVPHIMEHSVLAGSEKYPVRDPFFALFKMSMATFLNAYTSSDHTCYPVTSNVRADLMNLADVYFDAVFHPLLTESTFKREGWHYVPKDTNDPTGALSLSGIVYSEMKSAYSRPERSLWEGLDAALLPGTGYDRSSGGDPEHIPDLTYAAYCAFHRERYTPSAAVFATYGNIAPEAWAAFLDARLAGVKAAAAVKPPAVSSLAAPHLNGIQSVRSSYDSGEGSTAAKTFLLTGWRVPGSADPDTEMLFEILADVLGGDDAAPLKRAIVDSKLGTDFIGCSYGSEGPFGVFSVGIRGSEESRSPSFRALIEKTLREICGKGIPPDLVESAFRRMTYEVREIRDKRPLSLGNSVASSWARGFDAFAPLRKAEVLERCRAAFRKDPALFTKLIRRWLLDNSERVDIVHVPEPGLQRRAAEAMAKRLAAVRASMTDEQAKALAAEVSAMQKAMGAPESPEALAKLPQLSRADLPAAPLAIPTQESRLPSGITFLRNVVNANGVNYLNLAVCLEGLPEELWPSVPYYIDALNKLGAGTGDYAATARRESACSGGFNAAPFFWTAADGVGSRKHVILSIKMLDEQVGDALSLMADRVLRPGIDDTNRWQTVLAQGLETMKRGFLNDGPRLPQIELAGTLSEAGYLRRFCSGVSRERSLSALLASPAPDLSGLISAVHQIHAFTLHRNRWMLSFTGSDGAAVSIRNWAEQTLGALPQAETASAPTGFKPSASRVRLGFAAPLQVAHCVQMMRGPAYADSDASAVDVGMALVRVDYLISELRFKRNAYSAHCLTRDGLIILDTYADPNIASTLDVFAKMPTYIQNVKWSDADMTRAILSCAKDYINPIRPEGATMDALTAAIVGRTDACRRARYAALCGASAETVRAAMLKWLDPTASVGVLSNEEKLRAADCGLAVHPLF